MHRSLILCAALLLAQAQAPAPGGNASNMIVLPSGAANSMALKDLLAQRLDIRTFGVVGDGATADDANLLAAFASIGAVGKQAVIPGNTYKLLNQNMIPWGYGSLAAAEISVGGTVYSNGDTITLGPLNGNNAATAGICATPPVLTVTNAVGGVIQPGGVSITTPGNCSAGPTGSVIQSATSGGGSGAVFAVQWASYYSTSYVTNPRATFTGGGFPDSQYALLSLGQPAQILNGTQVSITPANIATPGQQVNVANYMARSTVPNSPVVALSSWGDSAAAGNATWGYNGGCGVSVANGQCWGAELDILAMAPNGVYHGLGLFMDGYYSPGQANALEIRGNKSWARGIIFDGGRGNPVSSALITGSGGTLTPLLGIDWRNFTFGLNEYTSPTLYLDRTITNWNTATGAEVGISGSAAASPAIYSLPYSSAVSNNASLRVIGGNGGSVLLQTGMTSTSGSGGTVPNFIGAKTQVTIADTPGASFSLTETGGRNAASVPLTTSGDTPAGTVLPFASTTGVAIGMTAAGTNVTGKVIAVGATTVTLDTAVSGDVPPGTSVTFSFTAQEVTIATSNNSNILINENLDFPNNTNFHALGAGALLFGNATNGTQFAVGDSGGASVAFPIIKGAASGGNIVFTQGGSGANFQYSSTGNTYHVFSNGNGNILQLLAPTASAVNRINIQANPAGTPANVTANQGDLSLGTAGSTGQAVINLGATADQAVGVFTSGATGAVTNNIDRVILANTVTSPFTLTMPPAPRDGQSMLIECDASVTLTVSANSGQTMVGTATGCSTTQGHQWHYRVADTKWRMDF